MLSNVGAVFLGNGMPAILEEFLRGILLYLLAEVSYKTQNCMHVYCQYLMGV